jgi:ribonucleoside-diphosphate reductase alpha chain
MIEQQAAAQSTQETETENAENMTQLEGIRQKVFIDRYSLKDISGNALEHYPEQMWARVARGIAEVEQTPQAQAEWAKKFYDVLADFQFVPGGRILAGAGSGHAVTFYNCMPPDQEVLTDTGYRPIAHIKVGDPVVTHRHRLRPVLHIFARETAETLSIIRPEYADHGDLRVTGDHKIYVIRSEWVGRSASLPEPCVEHEPMWLPARTMKPGDYVAVVGYMSDAFPFDFAYAGLKWVRVAAVTNQEYTGVVLDLEVEEDHSFVSAGVVVSNCFVIPSPQDSRQGILDNLKVMTEIMARGGGVGINLSTLRPRGSYIRTVNGTASGPCSWAQLYSVATGDVIQQGGCFGPAERIATDHGLIPAQELAERLDQGEPIQAQTHRGWRPFTAVFRNGRKELYEVTTSRGYQVRVTLDHKMGVQHNGEIATIPLRNLQEGNDILLLFGEGAKAELSPDTITSISPAGPSDVFDFEVADVHLLVANGIYTSNSRRGALMLMLDDDHPDIEEFITVKRTPGKIEHANLSVCVSDTFMQAVKDGTDWNLVWKGEVKKTVRARDLWDLICTSAWESAEPGVVFMDRYNKLSNTWYYEDIRCVNPCVTGETPVATAQGYTPARDLRIGMHIRTPAGLKPIEKMYNNGLQDIYRVDFSDGGSLRATADHKLKVVRDSRYAWVPVSELTQGSAVLVVPNETFAERQRLPQQALDYIAAQALAVAPCYDRQLGVIVGAVLGSGSFPQQALCEISFDAHEDDWYHTFNGLLADLHLHAQPGPAARESAGQGGVALKQACTTLQCRTLADLLSHIGVLPQPGVLHRALPLALMNLDKPFLAGLLDGLFSTNGSIRIRQENPLLGLYTLSNELAQQVRLLLLQFGIHGHISGTACAGNLADKTYDIVISQDGIARFYAEIGLSHPVKAVRLQEIAENWHLPGQTWTAAVVAVTDTGDREEVYDLYEPATLTWITNGYCSLDCGEQGLPPFGVCNLGALNLSAFVQNGQMDYERLAEKTRVAMRFLDNVVDATEYFIPDNAQAQLGTRRTGLGTMGLADALIKMKIAYGSDESVPIIEKIYTTIRDSAYAASSDYAVEKGAFPHFERDKYIQGHFIKQLPRSIQEQIRQHGTRNAVLLTQAPTGTTSLLAGVSSGIEPVYDFAMIRRDRTGEHILYHPLLQEWRNEHPNEATPHYFVSSKDLTPEEHVRVQATIQKYTDSSISKTVNAPNDHTIEQVQTLYRLAYETGCKGVTYYRDGSRDAVLTRIEEETKVEQKAEQQTFVMEPVTSIQQGIKPLPAVVHGYTRHLNSPEGKVNITINSDEHGPLEVFINVGKAGSDIAALAEALGRLISLNLRILSPLSQVDRAKVIAEQLRSIGGSRSVGFGAQQVRSMPDAVARALELHLASLQKDAEQQNESAPPVNGHNSEADPQVQEVSPLTLNLLNVTGNLCSECGCNTMIFEEGCKKCYSCGHSEC